MVCIFHFSHLPTQWGGLCPSSLRFCCFDATRRGIYPSSSCRSSFDMAGRGMPPPRCVFVSFSTRRGGVCPSSHSCFNMARRGMPPSHCVIPISTRRGGMCPRRVFVLLLTGNEGAAPRHIIYIIYM